MYLIRQFIIQDVTCEHLTFRLRVGTRVNKKK